jgi:hypothetical protein
MAAGDPADEGAPIPRDDSDLARVDVTLTTGAPYTPTPKIGSSDLRCFVLDWPIDDEVYVTGLAVRPGNPTLVHHVIAYLATPLGPPTKEGFPLRISSIQKKAGAQSGAHLRAAPPVPRPATRPSTREVVKSKRPSVRIETLSQAQIADLGLASLPPAAEESLAGRSLAGGKLLIESASGLPYGKPISGSGSCTVSY